jgi:hypothetical protein
VDRAALSAAHEVFPATVEELSTTGAQVAHVYGPVELPRGPFVSFPIPYVANGKPQARRWALRKAVEPRYVVTPFDVPEAVEEEWFQTAPQPTPGSRGAKIIGSFAREAVRPKIEQTLHRLQRTRDDVQWKVFGNPPTPVDLMGVDIWVDPAVHEQDYDGYVAEALVAGLPVVAARTAINIQRLEKGRTGLLVPPADPNETTHAILSGLFRPEVASNKVAAARQTASKFRARQRLRVLVHLYETLVT